MNSIGSMIGAGIILTLSLGMVPGVRAGDSKEQQRATEARAIRSAVERGQLMSLPRILALARKRVPGDVVKVELEHDDGRLQYEVKILTRNGRVREVELDAKTGALIKIEDD